MTERSSDTIRAVAWSEVFPWLRIVRAFRLAISVRSLVLGALGILLDRNRLGSNWADAGHRYGCHALAPAFFRMFLDGDYEKSRARAACDSRIAQCIPGAGRGTPARLPPRRTPRRRRFPHGRRRPILGSWTLLSQPAIQGLAQTGLPLRAVASVLLCGLWAAAVWALLRRRHLPHRRCEVGR